RIEDESIAVARDRPDETRFAGIVVQRASDCADSLTERAIGHDDVVPDAIEDFAPVYGFVAMLDEKHEQVEIARNERKLAPSLKEHAASRRENEIAELITRHVGKLKRNRIRSEPLAPVPSPEPRTSGADASVSDRLQREVFVLFRDVVL